MSKDWTAYARRILDAADRLHQIQARGDITADPILNDAALRNLQTLSEATQRLPGEEKEKFPAIPWQRISGFRNILVHNYLGEIDPETVRRILEVQLPPLLRAVLDMLDTRT